MVGCPLQELSAGNRKKAVGVRIPFRYVVPAKGIINSFYHITLYGLFQFSVLERTSRLNFDSGITPRFDRNIHI